MNSTIEELKANIKKCEERYRASFKTDSCREILESYNAWTKAKRTYYEALGNNEPGKEVQFAVNDNGLIES